MVFIISIFIAICAGGCSGLTGGGSQRLSVPGWTALTGTIWGGCLAGWVGEWAGGWLNLVQAAYR